MTSLNATSGVGSVSNIGGLKAYVAGPSLVGLATIILISDVYGYKKPNLRTVADKVAAAGYLAVVPDFFYGDPVINITKPNFDFEAWKKLHNTDKGAEDAKKVIAALKAKGVSSIGVAGFCWGGKVAVKLASGNDIKATVLLHPSWLVTDDIQDVNIPTAILAAEKDGGLTPQQLIKYEEILSKKRNKFDSFVKIYPGTAHGWTLKYQTDDKVAVKKAEEAHKDMLNWFIKHVTK
ncbi:DLH domain-containing protein [Cephalotus follicularis]|uniref:DLH domain-containing protein n=1 Tax=Cephalotus follicularis TaxID=3775 RepID=A0A1Q3AYU6_CEPFO|nr:DLH domain-containing protein [Cephalotus follicularis]